ncbi:MAG: RHS repeat-associated core domain-containing protein [Candidatus Limnocylindrales bacterium]
MPGQPTVSYTYDALGRRYTRSDGTTTATYAYVGAQIARIDRGGGQVTDSALDPAGDRLTVGGAWIVPTVRGDVGVLLDSGQTGVSDAYAYDPYGVTLAAAGTSVNPYRFGGRLLEPVSGQYDFGARQYDPASAAFTSLDTSLGQVADPLSLNRYLYAEANPASMIDPDGHAACRLGTDDCAGIAKTRGLDTLRAAAVAASAAASSAMSAARSAAANAAAAAALAAGPCRWGDPDACAGWKHSRAADASRAATYARAASSRAAAAAQTAAAAWRAVAVAESQLAAITRHGASHGLTRTIADRGADTASGGGAPRGAGGATPVACSRFGCSPARGGGSIGDLWAATGGRLVDNLRRITPEQALSAVAIGAVVAVTAPVIVAGAATAAAGIAAGGITVATVAAAAGVYCALACPETATLGVAAFSAVSGDPFLDAGPGGVNPGEPTYVNINGEITNIWGYAPAGIRYWNLRDGAGRFSTLIR